MMVRKKYENHGVRSGTLPEYAVYSTAKQRCTNPHVKCYPDYGGRGIEFRFASFKEFLAAVGRRPTEFHTLDRIDPDGHYESGNLRWETRKVQAKNRRLDKIASQVEELQRATGLTIEELLAKHRADTVL